jgi:hypothetical protein
MLDIFGIITEPHYHTMLLPKLKSQELPRVALNVLHAVSIDYKESSGIHQQRRKENTHISLSPRRREACNSTTLMQGITEIGA